MTDNEKMREWVKALDIEHSRGYELGDGRRVNTDNVTNIKVRDHWVEIEYDEDGTFSFCGLDVKDVCDFLKIVGQR
jgi:hypothetical protein